MHPNYENVNLTRPVLTGVRDFIDVFVAGPMKTHENWVIPAGGADLFAALVTRTDQLWQHEWTTRKFSQHEERLGELVTAVTYATASAELFVTLGNRIPSPAYWDRLSVSEPQRQLAKKLEEEQVRLLGLINAMIAELSRNPEGGEDSRGYVMYEIDEIKLKRLSYAHHLANVACYVNDRRNKGFGAGAINDWKSVRDKVSEPYRKLLYKSADFISGLGWKYRINGDLQGSLGFVKGSTRFFTLTARERRALATKLDRQVLMAA